MSVVKASLSFKKYNIGDKIKFGGGVTDALTLDASSENPLFPDLPESIKNLVGFTAVLIKAGEAMINGGRKASADAKKAVSNWNDAYTKTANYVTTVAAGDVTIVTAANMIPTKSGREKKQIPSMSTTFAAKINGTKGAILAGSKKKVARATAHIVTALPPGATISYQENTAIITIGKTNIYIGAFTGKSTELYSLDSGTTFSVSMFSVNAAGHGPATPAQNVIPQ